MQEITLWRKSDRPRKIIGYPHQGYHYPQHQIPHAMARHNPGDFPSQNVRTAPTPSGDDPMSPNDYQHAASQQPPIPGPSGSRIIPEEPHSQVEEIIEEEEDEGERVASPLPQDSIPKTAEPTNGQVTKVEEADTEPIAVKEERKEEEEAVTKPQVTNDQKKEEEGETSPDVTSKLKELKVTPESKIRASSDEDDDDDRPKPPEDDSVPDDMDDSVNSNNDSEEDAAELGNQDL